MIEVNLLPEQQGGRASRKRSSRKKSAAAPTIAKPRDPWSTALLVAGLIAVGGVGFMWWSQRATAGQLDDRLEAATADSARLAELRAVSDSLTERQQMVRQRVALVQQLDQGRFVWPHVMDEVSRALPRLAWLTRLQSLGAFGESSRFTIQGTAGNPLAITEFVRNLEASSYITDVQIMGSQQTELDGGDLVAQAFTLQARYVQPAGSMETAPIISGTGY